MIIHKTVIVKDSAGESGESGTFVNPHGSSQKGECFLCLVVDLIEHHSQGDQTQDPSDTFDMAHTAVALLRPPGPQASHEEKKEFLEQHFLVL